MEIVKTISMGFVRLFAENTNLENGLVRLFEIEYNQEYRNFRKNGIEIDAEFVRNYLNTVAK